MKSATNVQATMTFFAQASSPGLYTARLVWTRTEADGATTATTFCMQVVVGDFHIDGPKASWMIKPGGTALVPITITSKLSDPVSLYIRGLKRRQAYGHHVRGTLVGRCGSKSYRVAIKR